MRERQGVRVLVAAGVLALVAGSAIGCADDGGEGAASTTVAPAVARDFSGRGPYAVGVARLQLATGAPVDVFYPVDRAAVPADATGYAYTPEEVWGPMVGLFPPGVVTTTAVPDAWVDAPASTAGPFPVVVFSHGWGAMRFSYTFHDAHLASWGFVVAAPEHPSRDLQARLSGTQAKIPPSDVATISATLDLLGSEDSRPGGALEGRIATDDVAVEGHSAGGRDAALAAEMAEVDTWIALAGVPPVPDDAIDPGDVTALRSDFDLERYLRDHPSPDKPSMQIVAENDTGVPPSYGRSVYDALPPPKRFVELADTGHLIFYDSCASIQEQGGLQAVADALGLDRSSPQIRLAEDGCLPGDAPVAPLAAVWNHLTVAQLDWVFDIDGDVAAASLERDYLRTTFPGTIKEYLVDDR